LSIDDKNYINEVLQLYNSLYSLYISMALLLYSSTILQCPVGVLLGIFGGGVPPASPNPDPVSDHKMPFPIPVFRPDLVRD